MKLISSITFALFASLAVACVGAPEDIDETEATVQDIEAAAAAPEAAGGELAADPAEQDLTCPNAGTCEKANNYCVEPPSSWCDILTRCFDCGWPVEY